MLLPKRVTHKVIENSNKLLTLAHRIVPEVIQNQFVLYQLRTLSKEFYESGDLDFLIGKVVKFEVPEIGAQWFFTLPEHQNQIAIIRETDNHEVCFSASVEALVLMASQKVDPDTLFFNRKLKITGDTELGLEIKNLIDQFDIQQLHPLVQKGLDYWSEQLLELNHAKVC